MSVKLDNEYTITYLNGTVNEVIADDMIISNAVACFISKDDIICAVNMNAVREIYRSS